MSTFFPKEAPPRAHLYMNHYSFNSPKQLHTRCITTHPFNHKIQVFLPTELSPAIQSALTEKLLNETSTYYHAHIPLSLLLTSDFMQYIRNGMIALSVQGGIDTHDVVCLDGKGKLILNLTKDSYEQLGLSGKPSTFHQDRQRYVVEIDLNKPAMIPGKPGFERVKWCFENTLVTPFSMLFASVDSQGVSLPLEFPESVQATPMKFNIQSTPLNNIIIPDATPLRTIGKNDLRWRRSVSDLYEWVGLASIQSDRITFGDNIDPFLCVYSPPAPPTIEQQQDPTPSSGSLIEISGFIPSQSITRILEALRSLLDSSASTLSSAQGWANMTVWGFQDSPISWIGREHGHLVSGENMYSFFLWPSLVATQYSKDHSDNGVYVLLENVAAHDAHS
ncbi:hypothetical protein BGZ96_001602 [Linnemannia gamsii]|uniref:Uncharacterized protein n=1 Tax=Linnemannia gamsii TaxID=64522 RepID=A0ABQ7JM31_9FUNG|nr:hypothetical protein BGZ96_001602 [Linnemannia gamsii]